MWNRKLQVKMIQILNIEHTFQEVPFSASGSCTIAIGGQCKFRCKDCSWGDPKPEGTSIDLPEIKDLIKPYLKITDFVCILGEGATTDNDLVDLFSTCKKLGYKVVYYTGANLDEVPEVVLSSVDYIKTGRWIGKPLSDPSTNQKIYMLDHGNVKKEIVYSDFYK